MAGRSAIDIVFRCDETNATRAMRDLRRESERMEKDLEARLEAMPGTL